MTLIFDLMGSILDKTLNVRSVERALANASEELDIISTILSLSPEASLFLSVFTNLGDGEAIILSDVAKHVGCCTLDVLKLFPAVDELLEKGYIQPVKGNEKGYIVPDDVLRSLQKDEQYDMLQKRQKNLIRARDIVKRKLFYNDSDRENIFRVTRLLMPDVFRSLQKSLSERRLQKGFTCLLYGDSGTGKTETMYQIARITKRDILMVDTPDIKSKWMGDSERNMKAVFDNYRKCMANADEAPILLFNEADSFMGKRTDDGETWAEKEDNRMLNIILQELESFEGILFATTNRPGIFDSALHRRFLYKLELHRPNVETRKRILRDMLPELSDPDIEWVSHNFNISGGQIANISRRWMIEKMINEELYK